MRFQVVTDLQGRQGRVHALQKAGTVCGGATASRLDPRAPNSELFLAPRAVRGYLRGFCNETRHRAMPWSTPRDPAVMSSSPGRVPRRRTARPNARPSRLAPRARAASRLAVHNLGHLPNATAVVFPTLTLLHNASQGPRVRRPPTRQRVVRRFRRRGQPLRLRRLRLWLPPGGTPKAGWRQREPDRLVGRRRRL